MRLIGYRLRTFPFSLKRKEHTGEVMGPNRGCGRMRSRGARASGTAAVLAAVVLVPVGTAGAGWGRLFAPQADLWPRWHMHAPAHTGSVYPSTRPHLTPHNSDTNTPLDPTHRP